MHIRITRKWAFLCFEVLCPTLCQILLKIIIYDVKYFLIPRPVHHLLVILIYLQIWQFVPE